LPNFDAIIKLFIFFTKIAIVVYFKYNQKLN